MSRFPRLVCLSAAFVLLSACGGSEGRCTLRDSLAGAIEMRCPGGDAPLVPLGMGEQPLGGIQGVVRLFGRADHEGIEVEVVGTSMRTTTDAEGRFEFEGLRAGMYGVAARIEAYEEAEAEDIMVLPGAWTTQNLELRTGRRILGGESWEFTPSPVDETFLARTEGTLAVVWPEEASAITIASEVMEYRWTADGRWVVIRTGPTNDFGGGTLSYYVPAEKRMAVVAEDVNRWSLTPDRASFVVERIVDGVLILETHHVQTGRRASIGRHVEDWRTSPDGRSVVARMALPEGSTLVIWDVAAEGGTSLGQPTLGNLPTFAPDQVSLVYTLVEGQTFLWDGGRRAAIPLANRILTHLFDRAGEQLVYVDDEWSLYHWDMRTTARREIRLGVYPLLAFSPSGDRLAYFRTNDEGQVEAVAWSRETGVPISLGTLPGDPMEVTFDPSGAYLFVLDTRGRLTRLGGEGPHLLAEAAPLLPDFSPDGTSFVYRNGASLEWSTLGGMESTLLGEPGQGAGHPIRWSPDGQQLLFALHPHPEADPGAEIWLFDRTDRSLGRLAYDGTIEESEFLPDGTIVLRQRIDNPNASFRGALVFDGDEVLTGVKHWRHDGAGKRFGILLESLPLSERNVLVLWEPPPGPGEEATLPEGGLLPIDSGVTGWLSGEEWLAWAREGDEAGLYITHWPRDLPLAYRSGSAPAGSNDEMTPSSEDGR